MQTKNKKAEKELYAYIKACVLANTKSEPEIIDNTFRIARSLNREEFITEEWIRDSIAKAGRELDKRRQKIIDKQTKFEETFMFLEKRITDRPIRIDKKDMEPGAHLPAYHTVNDRFIKIDSGGISWIELILALALFILFGYRFIDREIQYNKLIKYHIELVDKGMHQEDKIQRKGLYIEFMEDDYRDGGLEALEKGVYEYTHDPVMTIWMSVVLLGLLFWMYQATKSIKDMLIFDRELGMVTYVCHFGKKKITKPFDWVLFQSVMSSMHYGGGFDVLAVRFTRHSVFYLTRSNIYASISFYVWYMDRNRPLPPGEMLDEYREADYLRRKSEGFPKPQYYSSIKTPEWSGAIEKYGDKDAQKRDKNLYS